MPVTETSFLCEIEEQPDALRRLTSFFRAQGEGLLHRWAERAKRARRVVFCGMGTSEFVPEVIFPALARQGIDATSFDAGELLHYPRPLPGLLVLISQSGESIETRCLAEQFGQGGFVAITNAPQSTIGRLAEFTLPLCAGAEASITTKTYTNSLALLHLLAAACESVEAVGRTLSNLNVLAAQLGSVDRGAIERGADLLADATVIHFVARGPALVAAKQAALTFMEGARCPAQPFSGGSFRHGPFELVEPGHRCVFFLPEGSTLKLLQAMMMEVAGKGSRVVALTNAHGLPQSEDCVQIVVPACAEEFFPLAAATAQELWLEAVARRRGLVAGQFRHGQKITIRE